MISDVTFTVSSFLMATLFAVSASFQVNDQDWYFWIPLYTSGSIVNLVNGFKTNARSRKLAKFAFWLGLYLFFKVVLENIHYRFWSVDMRERVVREKLGSFLVITSMFLHLDYSSVPERPTRLSKYGNPTLAVFAYSLSFGFFMFQQEEMMY